VDDVLKTLHSWCMVDKEYDHSGVHSVQKAVALNEVKWAPDSAARRRGSGPPP